MITLDDATSEIVSAFLVPEEDTRSSFRGLVEVVERHGLFMELYTDRGSHDFVTPAAGGKVSKTQLTQVGRALRQLGIGHIAAYSPEARGRCERTLRTLQDRLPKELALAGITTIESANRFLREVYLRAHNARFAGPAEEPASAFVEVPGGALARRALPVGRAPGRQRQLRPLARPLPADPADAAPSPSGPHQGPHPRLPGRDGRRLQGAAAPGELRAGRRARPGTGCVTTATRQASWICGQTLRVAHEPHRHHHHNRGQFTRYLTSTKPRALYTVLAAGAAQW